MSMLLRVLGWSSPIDRRISVKERKYMGQTVAVTAQTMLLRRVHDNLRARAALKSESEVETAVEVNLFLNGT
jgi:hypothetical protein